MKRCFTNFLFVGRIIITLPPILPIAISNIRKYSSGLLTVWQTQSQIFDLYGTQQARNIINNCYTKCYLPGQPLETARELEIICGKYEYVDDDNVRRVMPLLSMDAIRVLDESILLIGNKPAIKMKLRPYYEIKWMKN
ncbi:MAG: TraM recognition domain-containing protein [Bacteroidetes bacterium]|nr:TraM recognition domain-containing protein [Bacteroidota bacterium]